MLEYNEKGQNLQSGTPANMSLVIESSDIGRDYICSLASLVSTVACPEMFKGRGCKYVKNHN